MLKKNEFKNKNLVRIRVKVPVIRLGASLTSIRNMVSESAVIKKLKAKQLYK